MIKKLMGYISSPASVYSPMDLKCPMCKTLTTIQVGRQVQWRLDCLNCIKTPGVSVVITEYRREEKDRSSFTEFKPIFTKMHINLPDNNNSYVWKFDYQDKKTYAYKVDAERGNPLIHIFDELIDINLDNFIPKTKMCLLFG